MATVPENDVAAPDDADSMIDDDAFDLICCFYNGLDDVVRELAQQTAIEDGSHLDDDPTMVLVKFKHVEAAGCAVLNAVRSLLANKTFPVSKHLTEIAQMSECFSIKTT